MKPESEAKILKSFLEIIESPGAKERSCRRISLVLFTIGMLCLFFLFSDNMQFSDSRFLVIGTALFSGLCFGLGVWFIQMGFQTQLVARHLSKKSISERIEEINI